MNGPYNYIRRPRYLSIIILPSGISFIFLRWITLLLVATAILLLIRMINDKENLMHDEFT